MNKINLDGQLNRYKSDYSQYDDNGNYNLSKSPRSLLIARIAQSNSKLFKPKMTHLLLLREFVDGYRQRGGLSSSDARAYLVRNIRALKQEEDATQIRNLFDFGKNDGFFGGYNYAKFFKGVLEFSFGESNAYVAERFYKIACAILYNFPIDEEQIFEDDPRYTAITKENSYIQSCSNPNRVFTAVIGLQESLDKMTDSKLYPAIRLSCNDYLAT